MNDWYWYWYLNYHFRLKVIFHWRLSVIKIHLPSKVILHWWLSSMEGHLPLKVIFDRGSSSIKGHLPSNIVSHLKQIQNQYLRDWKIKIRIKWMLLCSQKRKRNWKGWLDTSHSRLISKLEMVGYQSIFPKMQNSAFKPPKENW